MKHIHYGDWTIEWERGYLRAYNFYIRTQQWEPRHMRTRAARYWVMNSLNLESSLKECQDLIDKIIEQQNRVTLHEVLSFHDKHESRSTLQPVAVSSPSDDDNVTF